jgi:chemotaxis signal transduction protein
MVASTEALSARLLDLRASFDRAFSEPERDQAETRIDLLLIRVGRERFALKFSEIAALEADRTITAVPSEHSELVGIAGMRGAVVAVFDLATLLELPRPDGPRWLVLAKGAPIAFAFTGFEGQKSVRPEALASTEPGGAGRFRAVVKIDEREDNRVSLPVIDIPALVVLVDRRSRSRGEHAV